LQKNLNFALQNRNVPELAVVEVHQLAFFADSGKIQPLDDLVKADPSFQPDDLLSGVMTDLRYQGQLFGLPINRSTPVLYYNKDRFAAAGLDPDKPPTTWQELREMAGKLTPEDHSQYGFLAIAYPWIFESLVWTSGGQLVSDGVPTFGQGAPILRLWADMIHRDKTARFAVRREWNTEFKSGRAAMAIDSSAQLQGYTSQTDFKVGVAWLPHAEGGPAAVPVGGAAAVMPSRVPPERQTAAWKFLSWLVSTEQTAAWSRATGYVPLRRSACDLLRSDGFYREHPEFEVAVTQLSVARESPGLPDWDLAAGAIEKAMVATLKNDAPAGASLKIAENVAAHLLDVGLPPSTANSAVGEPAVPPAPVAR
jgi:sn-glycerol 3-phosphate transport system substrate-binding protein